MKKEESEKNRGHYRHRDLCQYPEGLGYVFFFWEGSPIFEESSFSKICSSIHIIQHSYT